VAEAPDGGFRVTDRRQQDASSDVDSPSAPPERSLIALGDARPAHRETTATTGARLRRHRSPVVVRDKTEGHRSAEETRALDDLIYDLQLRYVKAVKSPAG